MGIVNGVHQKEIGTGQKDLSALDRFLDMLVPARRQRRQLARQNDRLEAFSRAIPLEYCGWDQEGVQAVSPGFAALLGLHKIDNITDIQQALAPGDAAALEGLYDRLQQYGEHFELHITPQDEKRSLKLFGKRGVLRQGQEIFLVIWGMDVSDFSEMLFKSMEEVAKVERRENDLRAALNALPFPLWIRNHKLDLTWCNRFYARTVDDTAAAVIADQKELPMTGTSRADMTQRVLAQRALAKNAAQAVRGHVIVEGRRRLMEMSEIPLSSEKRMVGVALDITHEEELALSYDQLATSQRETLEQLRTAIVMFDADTKLEFYNSAYEEMTGLSGTWMDTNPKIVELIDKLRELRRLPEQADYKIFKQQWLSRFTSLLEPYEEMQYLPDGSVLRMIVVPRPMGGLLITQEDVTSRLKLETSYNTLIAVQQETLDNLGEAIAVYGEDGRLKLHNSAFCKLWGISSEELEALPHITQLVDRIKPFFTLEEWPTMRDAVMGNALERQPRKGRLQRNDGIVLEYSVMPLPDGNILNAYSDITDTFKVEQALMERNAALEEAEKLKTDFLANVSYQLRTPLNAIMGFTEMLHHQYFGKLNERQMEYTSNMIEAGQRLVSLVNDILDLSTIEAGYLKLYPTEVKVRGLIERVTHLVQEWARKQNIDIYIQCPDEIMIFGDERRMKQVLLNLISNAINYSPAGGRVTLAAEISQDHVILTVKDTGTGIPPDDLARVFTPFEKIRSGKTQRRSGAGLGLSLVKSIIQLHGGEVLIESKEGQGTSVICRLPPLAVAMQKMIPPPEELAEELE